MLAYSEDLRWPYRKMLNQIHITLEPLSNQEMLEIRLQNNETGMAYTSRLSQQTFANTILRDRFKTIGQFAEGLRNSIQSQKSNLKEILDIDQADMILKMRRNPGKKTLFFRFSAQSRPIRSEFDLKQIQTNLRKEKQSLHLFIERSIAEIQTQKNEINKAIQLNTNKISQMIEDSNLNVESILEKIMQKKFKKYESMFQLLVSEQIHKILSRFTAIEEEYAQHFHRIEEDRKKADQLLHEVTEKVASLQIQMKNEIRRIGQTPKKRLNLAIHSSSKLKENSPASLKFDEQIEIIDMNSNHSVFKPYDVNKPYLQERYQSGDHHTKSSRSMGVGFSQGRMFKQPQNYYSF